MHKPMKYGMYRIDKKFIEHMKNRIEWIIDPALTDLYVGPVLTVDEKWSFYAPVTSKPDGSDKFFIGKDKSIAGFVHVRKMIPCRRELLRRDRKSSPESRFCMSEDNRRIIKAAAQLLYEAEKERGEEE